MVSGGRERAVGTDRSLSALADAAYITLSRWPFIHQALYLADTHTNTHTDAHTYTHIHTRPPAHFLNRHSKIVQNCFLHPTRV